LKKGGLGGFRTVEAKSTAIFYVSRIKSPLAPLFQRGEMAPRNEVGNEMGGLSDSRPGAVGANPDIHVHSALRTGP
jgi:hypothetical protein